MGPLEVNSGARRGVEFTCQKLGINAITQDTIGLKLLEEDTRQFARYV